MSDRTVMFEISRAEAGPLRDLLGQFRDLLSDSPGQRATGDPAIARLVPDAYPDDALASEEFRDLTEVDLLQRRDEDARRVLESLGTADDPGDGSQVIVIDLGPELLESWIRTLAAVRLVLAARLDIRDDDDHDDRDPRFGVYDWLGFRLESLLQAADPEL